MLRLSEVGLDGGNALDLDTDILGQTCDLDGRSGGLVGSKSLQSIERREDTLLVSDLSWIPNLVLGVEILTFS